ncbi:MAG: hypothetical protein LBC12_05790 [Nitrososphaerota archaeon]|nr:hypothetical protein [Nitrososphaerota archaeon]
MLKWKNIIGTADRKPKSGYDSWLDFYEQNSGKSSKTCKVKGCTNKATVGAHVRKARLRKNQDRSWYIVPLCHSCTHIEDMFELNADASPVSVRLHK